MPRIIFVLFIMTATTTAQPAAAPSASAGDPKPFSMTPAAAPSASAGDLKSFSMTPAPDEKLKAEWELRFRNADKNHDRALDRAEADAGLPKILSRNFDTIDVNADRRITPEELWAMHQREVAARNKRRAERVSGPPR